jgi:3-oxoacyl-[acyl-carrier protein] reductase/2-deoxy-D-gluconate 3-dehydrogenase
MRLDGKTALIVGAGRNNGRAIATTFAREGAELLLVARERQEELAAVAEACRELGARVTTRLADVSQPEQAGKLVADTISVCGRVDVLVSTVGVRPHRNLWETSVEEWHQVLAANVGSLFYLTRELAPYMIARRRGSIVALGGATSFRAGDRASALTASKHALLGLIRALAQELGPYGIRANMVAPSRIENVRLEQQWYTDTGDPNQTAAVERIALRRLGRPNEVANAPLFLASDESSFTTGSYIVCNGGATA